ncbi:hypothetical protein Tco_1374164 [Tanacetum coccineum]|uniref:Uncharacterized protein n=1 Tax=Tanacetum coccineum TaxID=301880 RepID=A0ABQ5AV37_9ASTR
MDSKNERNVTRVDVLKNERNVADVDVLKNEKNVNDVEVFVTAYDVVDYLPKKATAAAELSEKAAVVAR